MISRKQSILTQQWIARFIAVLLTAIVLLASGCQSSPSKQLTNPPTDVGLTTPDMLRTDKTPITLSHTEPIDEQEAVIISERLEVPLEIYDALRPGGSIDINTLERVEVERVVDGDTMIVLRRDESVRLRLIGVDAPESYSHHDNSARTHIGESVSRIVKEWLDGKVVYLQFDKTETDQYDRLLAYAWLDGHTMINEVLVREGLVKERRYEPTTRYNDYFQILEKMAQKEKRGVWSP